MNHIMKIFAGKGVPCLFNQTYEDLRFFKYVSLAMLGVIVVLEIIIVFLIWRLVENKHRGNHKDPSAPKNKKVKRS